MEDYLQNFTLPLKIDEFSKVVLHWLPSGWQRFRSFYPQEHTEATGASDSGMLGERGAQPPALASSFLALLELCPGSWINPVEGSNKHPQSLQRLND